MHADGDWQAVEGVLSKGIATTDEHLQTWKLNLKTTKTVSAVFHLNNRKLNMSQNPTTTKPCFSAPNPNTVPRSNVRQIAQVSPTPRVTSQEVDITCRAP